MCFDEAINFHPKVPRLLGRYWMFGFLIFRQLGFEIMKTASHLLLAHMRRELRQIFQLFLKRNLEKFLNLSFDSLNQGALSIFARILDDKFVNIDVPAFFDA